MISDSDFIRCRRTYDKVEVQWFVDVQKYSVVMETNKDGPTSGTATELRAKAISVQGLRFKVCALCVEVDVNVSKLA